MTFITKPYSFSFRSDLMRDRNIIINFCMTFDTPDISKMYSLVWKPVMLFNNINLGLVTQKLKIIVVRVAIKTDSVVIGNSLFKISTVSDRYLVGVRIMTFPAGKSFILHFKVSALTIFRIYLFKMIFCKFRVTTMAINTNIFLFHSQLPGMRELHILFRMAVGTTKAPMI